MDNWHRLLAAHEHVRNPGRSVMPDHKPVAAILSCSDARVPPSVIFDQDAGELFVVRVAGNIATSAAVASIDYAIDELNVRLVIVLGHTSCGAVGAACAGTTTSYLQPLISQIAPLLGVGGCPGVDLLAERNILASIQTLTTSTTPTGEAIRAGNVAVRGVIYEVDTDTLRSVHAPELTCLTNVSERDDL